MKRLLLSRQARNLAGQATSASRCGSGVNYTLRASAGESLGGCQESLLCFVAVAFSDGFVDSANECAELRFDVAIARTTDQRLAMTLDC